MRERKYKLGPDMEAHVFQSVAGPAVVLSDVFHEDASVIFHKPEARKLLKLLEKFLTAKEIKRVVR